MTRVGLISDTHGLLRPQALDYLRGCARIIHAGDIGTPEVLQALSALARVDAVRGNNDRGAWARGLPETLRLAVEGVEIFVIHDIAELSSHRHGADVVVAGHSHKPLVTRHGEVLLVNPGSAGPRRFKLPVSVGELSIDGGQVEAHLVELASS